MRNTSVISDTGHGVTAMVLRAGSICKQRSHLPALAHSAVMIFCRISHIFTEPFRRGVGIGCFLCGKFHFSQKNALIFSVKDIQFDKKSAFFRDHVAVFCDEDSICLGFQVFISFCGERKIILLTAHQSYGFISEKIVIVLSSDADHR